MEIKNFYYLKQQLMTNNISKEILPVFEVNYIFGEDVLNNGAKKVGVNGFRGIVERDMLSSNQVDSGQILLF